MAIELGETNQNDKWYWLEGPEVIIKTGSSTQELIKWCNNAFGPDNWDVDVTRWYFRSKEDRLMFIITWY